MTLPSIRVSRAVAIALLTLAICCGAAQPSSVAATGALQSCVVIYDEQAESVWRSDTRLCTTRLAPASTFKIPHALVALETGVVTADTLEKWDGTPHSDTPAWDRDHTIASAMLPSVLWFFQRVAPRVGAARMHQWLDRMHYGNARTGGDVTRYWLNGTLQISPVEQVGFLREFYAERLPIGREHQRLVRQALDQPPGTVQNARGTTRLAGTWDARDLKWNGKTGRSSYSGRGVSWLVGELSTAGHAYVFAAAVWGDGAAVDFLDGAHLAVKTFIARGVLEP